jgi:FkbM family methyltransferase
MPLDLYPHHLATWSRPVLEAAIRRRVQSAYLGDGLVLARILGRHKILLRSTDRGFACHLMLDGFWEMWLTQFLARHVNPGMTVIDVGANFGYFTLLLGDAVGASGRVIAVEPNPETAGLLRETVLLNGHATRTRIVDKALSDATGTGWLFSPDSEPKNATLVGRPNIPGGRTFEIPTVALDDIALEGPRVDLVKIDAEGAEVSIVQGMRRLIERDRPMIVLEFNPSRYAEPSQFLDGLLASYDTARQLVLDGTIVPLDKDAVLDRTDHEDRILLFAPHA